WVERSFLRPTFLFKYWGFAWVEPWPAWGLYWHMALLAVAALMMAAGLFYRFASCLVFLGFAYLELLDVTGYLNHYYLVVLLALLLACMPLGRAGSLDVWRRPDTRLATFPSWCTWLVRGQLALVYGFAAQAKLTPDWLLHGQPLGLWLAGRSEHTAVAWLASVSWAPLAMSWAGFAYDLTIPLWLSWRRTRLAGYLVVIAFHAAVGMLFNIGLFPFIMVGAALVFFSPSWPRLLANAVGRAIRGVRQLGAWQLPIDELANRPMPRSELANTGLANNAVPRSAAPLNELANRESPIAGDLMVSRAALFLMAGYCLVQVLMPLRHLCYPGNVLWHEQGMRWSWRVLAREKNGSVSYEVTLGDGRRRVVSPRRYLTEYQAREMSTQPDLILALAKRIARDLEVEGQGPVAVRADALASLNGRPAARLIDPSVDLAKVHDGIAIASWILPQPTSSGDSR
ncbi:MAG: gamma carboxylase, partial [Myxococcales bacterium]|nr:gamma carboxylase [Myxococcales bacterium]